MNEKAERLLQDLELLELIRMHKENPSSTINWADKYKGSMAKQDLKEIEQQLNELREEWE